MNSKSATKGILSFFIILFLMPLGHAFVVLMARHLEGFALNMSAFALGASGIAIAVLGNRLRSKAMQILAGAFGAILFWGSWVEFMYISYGQSLHVPPLVIEGEVYTKPEYLMMPSAIPFAALSLIMYTYMAHTNWGVILILRKWLGIKQDGIFNRTGESISAFIDLLLLIWWAYLILLVEFDPGLLGLKHPVTMIFATICLISGLILLVRSLNAKTWASALRQAIVTVCVLWTYIEVMIKLRLFTEVWIYPEKYVIEMILLVFAFVTVLFVIAFLGHRGIKSSNNE